MEIEDILAGMRFERRRPIPQHTRAAYAALQAQVGEALRELGQLHLQLWHAQERRDYHALPLEQARDRLRAACRRLDAQSGEQQ